MPRELRHLQFSQKLDELRLQLTDNALDTNQALSAAITGRIVTVSGYMATGATTTKIPLPISQEPGAVTVGILLLRAYPTADPAADMAAVGRINFSQQAQDLFAFEPSGLIANRPFDLTFLVIEGS